MIVKMIMLALAGLAAIGLGAPLLRLLAPNILNDSGFRMGLAGMLGLFVAASVAIVLNFLFPITSVIAFALIAVGLALLLPVIGKIERQQWVMYAALAAAVTPLAIFLWEGYDGGLYHLPHQYWLATEKAVIGLANLHGRFGFNSVIEPLFALGWFGGDDLAVVPLLAGLFGLMLLAMLFEGMHDAGDRRVLLYVTGMLGLGYVWAYIETRGMGWASTDLPAATAVAACIYCGFASAVRDDRDYLVLAFFFAAFAAALKLSGAFAALFPLGLAALWIARHGMAKFPVARLVLIGMLFLPYVARNLAVSGCLAYPAALTCLPLQWEASQSAANDAMWITAWARAPATGLEHLHGWAWLPAWFERNETFLLTYLAVTVIALAIAMVTPGDRSQRRQIIAPILIFSAYAVAATVLWFLAAPDPRFGLGHILALAMAPGLWLLALGKPQRIPFPTDWVPVSVLIGSLIFGVGNSWKHGNREEKSLFTYRPVHIEAVETRTEGAVRRPAKADRCLLAPPPCSPYGADREDTLGPYRAYFPKR